MLDGTSPDLSRPGLSARSRPRLAPLDQRCARPAAAASHGVRNELLATLPDEDLARIVPRLERVPLRQRQVLQERDLPALHAYFIERGLASLLVRADERASVEIATLGRRDFVGMPLVLGTIRSSQRCVVQVPGEALSIRAEALPELMDEAPALRRILLASVRATMMQSAQLVACNTLHNLAERLARWLLVAQDRLGDGVVPLTHENLGRALGVRRAGITTTMGRMEQAGLIRRGRGSLTILDREGLELTSCKCYRAIRTECRRVLRPRWDEAGGVMAATLPA